VYFFASLRRPRRACAMKISNVIRLPAPCLWPIPSGAHFLSNFLLVASLACLSPFPSPRSAPFLLRPRSTASDIRSAMRANPLVVLHFSRPFFHRSSVGRVFFLSPSCAPFGSKWETVVKVPSMCLQHVSFQVVFFLPKMTFSEVTRRTVPPCSLGYSGLPKIS